MPKTNAERQQAWRLRRAARITVLEAEAAQLRAQDDALRADLGAALAECERLAATQCKHPPAPSTAGHAGQAAPRSGSPACAAALQGQAYQRQVPESAARAIRRGAA